MKLLSFLLLFALLLSCETVVTDDIRTVDTEPLLVVEGGVERFEDANGHTQRIRLTTTNNFLSDDPNPIVDNAEVSILADEVEYFLTYQGDGVYSNSSITPQFNTTYTLKIIWGEKSYTASDDLNQVPNIERVYTEFEEETLFTDEGYFLKLDSRDIAGVPNYYHYRVYRNGELVTNPDPGNSRSLVLSDEFFDGQLRTEIIPNEEVVYELGDMAMVDQMGISEAYFNFLFQIYDQTGSGGGGFVANPPPASIRGNIIGGNSTSGRALGFFYAADVARAATVVVE